MQTSAETRSKRNLHSAIRETSDRNLANFRLRFGKQLEPMHIDDVFHLNEIIFSSKSSNSPRHAHFELRNLGGEQLFNTSQPLNSL